MLTVTWSCVYMLEGGCFNQTYLFGIIKFQTFPFCFLLKAFIGDLISIDSALCGKKNTRDLEKL